mmetsp:Transcript_1649/g.4606  ORF Transcript_1649/g.4606 Transcript_1649/m.4606 type:complete len:289 (-) Transcript_1649:145-1011(-)
MPSHVAGSAASAGKSASRNASPAARLRSIHRFSKPSRSSRSSTVPAPSNMLKPSSPTTHETGLTASPSGCNVSNAASVAPRLTRPDTRESGSAVSGPRGAPSGNLAYAATAATAAAAAADFAASLPPALRLVGLARDSRGLPRGGAAAAGDAASAAVRAALGWTSSSSAMSGERSAVPLTFLFAMRVPNWMARFCSEAQRERPIERARRRSTSLSPTPGGRRGSQRKWRGVAASVATTSSSRNGYRASRPWSLTTRSSRPKLRFHSRARSAASSAPKPAQPPRLKAVR